MGLEVDHGRQAVKLMWYHKILLRPNHLALLLLPVANAGPFIIDYFRIRLHA
ncbi:hypothetical protein LY78DRAFT_376575 [Colletotrichum sublineola]|nr:hypothetical protein LY78DRAFT_376575 [Colletotrichum sublineola]